MDGELQKLREDYAAREEAEEKEEEKQEEGLNVPMSQVDNDKNIELTCGQGKQEEGLNAPMYDLSDPH